LSIEVHFVGDHESFHFFKWLCACPPGQPEELLAEAFRRAEQPREGESPDLDICHVLKARLAEVLAEVLYAAAPDLHPDHTSWEAGTVDVASDDALLRPILGLALARVDCGAIAQLMLMQAGKCLT
jgi:hypothetical protein